MSNPATNPPVIPAMNAAREVVASYADYADAQAAVDRLSDQQFPVASTQIVGNNVKTVETVTGRVTKGRAALSGAAGGAWFGLMLGVLFGLFTTGAGWFAIMLSAVVIGAVWGAVFGFVGHWATRGRRDFSSVQTLSAERYDVLVDSARASEAARILFGTPAPSAH
jgi:hypothetical protein